MEESFKLRVDKALGSLAGDTPASAPAGVSHSLWCLTGDEIERKEELNRSSEEDDDDDAVDRGVESEPSVLPIHQLESDPRGFSDCDEKKQGERIDGDTRKRRRSNHSVDDTDAVDEHLEIQSNIGRDCTLDHEEEEGVFDKMAVGTERSDNCICMREVQSADNGVDGCRDCNELVDLFHTGVKDHRMNHVAAKSRLREDTEAAESFGTSQLSGNSVTPNAVTGKLGKREANGFNHKSILRRQENSTKSKSQKRVRFTIEEQRHTFDPSKEAVDGQNKIETYMNLVQYVRKRIYDSLGDEDAPAESPKSITPRRKPDNSSSSTKTSADGHRKNDWSLVVTAEDTQHNGMTTMGEDEFHENQ